jgi:hypothetical protein
MYDRESIVQVLIESLQEMIPDEVEITADSNVIELDRAYDFFGSLEVFEWQMLIEERLCVGISTPEMAEFFIPSTWNLGWDEWNRTIVPQLTVGALAEFILERASRISFEPVSILGSPPCAAAGYFQGMTGLVQSIRPHAPRFGPSTPIRHVLSNSELRRFWRRLSRSTRPLPPLEFTLTNLANAILIGSSLLLIFGVMVDWAILAMVWMICLKGISFGCWLRRRVHPLPLGIVTFGDLARHQARYQS